VDCENPPSDGWGRDYAKYATWSKCCGGEPYSSPGVGCKRGSSWGKTECSGYSGGAVKSGGASFAQAAATLALAAPPEQAGAWMAAGFALDMWMSGLAASNRSAQERKRAAEAAREEERRRRAEEERQRLEAIHARLTRALKKDASWAGESGAPTVGSLALKTDTNVFGTRKGGGLALKKDDGESAKHASDRVETQLGPAPESVPGLTRFEQLSLAFAETSDAAVESRQREEEARRHKDEAAKRRAEAQTRRDELRRELEEKRRREAEKPPAPEQREPTPGEPERELAERDPAVVPPEKRADVEGPDRLAEAEELLRIAIGEDERQGEALKQAEERRADAEQRMDEAKSRLREHMNQDGGRG
jgi:hypothetical protein